MKQTRTILSLLITTVCVLSGCQFVTEEITADHCDFDMIESVGGIALGTACQTDDGAWFLPLRCDLSGCTTVTREPVMVNSGLAVREIHARIEKEALLLWIESCVYTEKSSTPQTDGILLEGVEPGRYKVEYLSADGRRDAIGTVVIGE